MGIGSSRLPSDLPGVPETERFWGLDNFGNTCYVNSVVQALYCCKLFRSRLLQFVEDLPEGCVDNGVLCALAALFREVCPCRTCARVSDHAML